MQIWPKYGLNDFILKEPFSKEVTNIFCINKSIIITTFILQINLAVNLGNTSKSNSQSGTSEILKS